MNVQDDRRKKVKLGGEGEQKWWVRKPLLKSQTGERIFWSLSAILRSLDLIYLAVQVARGM